MIKAFENLEVWFVTGAQLLYGGDAVVQVDGHSQQMVDGMNASGILPANGYAHRPWLPHHNSCYPRPESRR